MNRLFVGYSRGGARKSRFMRGNTTTSFIRIKLTWTTPCYAYGWGNKMPLIWTHKYTIVVMCLNVSSDRSS